MPLIKVQTSLKEIDSPTQLIKALSSEVSVLTGKPEKYVMAILETNIPMSFAGCNSPCCYIEIKSIGSLKPTLMSKAVCNLISNKTEIPPDRIYISFDDIEASNWGFNGSTFG
tara:strand:- start:489 stop:827 length:339 start_codon:yes stop_codon:yes gene_type:complete